VEKENSMDDTIEMQDAKDSSTDILENEKEHAEEKLLKDQSAAFIKKSFLQWNGLGERASETGGNSSFHKIK
jgi:hypothetical protein